MDEIKLIHKDELMHYGVVGMKWGVRRAVKKDAYANAKRKAYKKADRAYSRSVSKYNNAIGKKRTAKAFDNMEAKAKAADKAKKDYMKVKDEKANQLYSKQSKEVNAAVNRMSAGGAVARSLVLGSFGTLKYTEAKTKGASTGQAYINSYLHEMGNMLTGGVLSTIQYLDNRAARKH